MQMRLINRMEYDALNWKFKAVGVISNHVESDICVSVQFN